MSKRSKGFTYHYVTHIAAYRSPHSLPLLTLDY